MRHNLTKRAAMLIMGLISSVICWGDNDYYAQRHDFEVDGIFYRYNADGQSVSVTYRFSSYNNKQLVTIETPYSGDVVIPAQVTYNDVVYPVTGIDQYTFQEYWGGSSKITSITLPSTIKSIGRYAFNLCRNIVSLDIPNSVTSIGSGAFSSCEKITELVIPDAIKTIEPSTFSGCKKLSSITLSSGITSIGNGAFYQCFELKNICFSDETPEEGKLRIPDGVTYIGDEAFYQCRNLNAVTIPASVKRIGNSAFCNTNITYADIKCNLAEMENGEFLNIGTGVFSFYGYRDESELTINLPDYYSALALCLNNSIDTYQKGVHLYANGNLITDYPIPENVWAIPANSFDYVTDMKTVTLPSNLQVIENCAFSNCTGLEKVVCTNADALTTIQNQAFYGCSNLTEFYFGPNIKTIGDGAFYDCKNLMKVDIGDLANWCEVDFQGSFQNNTGVFSNPLCYAKRIYLNGQEVNNLSIPTGVETIKKYAFCGTCRFDKLTIPKTVTTIEDYAFAYCEDLETIVYRNGTTLSTLGDGVFYGCSGLKNVTLPNSVTSMGSNMFRTCDNLESVTLPSGITTIPLSTFYYCTSLSSVLFPEGLTAIGNYAFYNCNSLEQIAIPASVNYIGTDAFNLCNSLKGVYISDLAAWCKIEMPGQERGGGWAETYNMNNPLLFAHNLYLNNELVTDLVIPQGVEAVEALTFAGATCLKSVTIPEGCKRLGGGAFYKCSNINTIRIPSSMETFETVYFYDGQNVSPGPFYYTNQTDVKLYIEDLETWINKLGSKFRIWTSNASHHIDMYVKGILMKDLVIPECITKMDNPFYGFSFTSVTLPSGLAIMLGDAFKYCTKIKYVFSRSRYAPTGTDGLLLGKSWNTQTDLQAIYVPAGRASNYKTSWPKSAGFILEAPENVNFTGPLSFTALSDSVDAHNYVYDDVVPYLDLTGAILDETVTAESLQDIADKGTIVFLPEGTEGIEGTNIVANGRTPKLILRDSTNFAAPYDFTADELEYQRYFPASRTEATTMCLPYDMNELPQGMKAYQLTGQDTNDNAVFEEVDVIEANKPYVVTTTKNVDGLVGENVLVKATPTEMPDAGNEAFEFRGTLSTISHDDAADEEAYVLTEGRQWLSAYDANEDVYVPAGRAYLVPADAAFVSFGTVLNTTSHEDYLPGDVNGDKQVDLSDAIMVTYYSLHVVLSNFNTAAADMNGDGQIDLSDAIVIIYKSLGVK